MTVQGQLFKSARAIMKWLSHCAKVFLSSFNYKINCILFTPIIYFILEFEQMITSENQQVRWATPLGLQVVQPYMKTERHLVSFLDCN